MRKLYLLGLGGALLATAALAQSITLPQVTSIGPTDLFQDIPSGVPTAQSVYAPAPLLGNYSQTLPGNNPENLLIGGDATTNLWQRATTGASVTTTTTYGGPDRWAYTSGTNTAMTVSRVSTAGEVAAGSLYGFKVARTAAQTGVVQVCISQAVESANSYLAAGQTMELDVNIATGSTFSGTGVALYISYGTGSDEGVAKMVYGINAGGGAGAAWTGQVNKTATITIPASSGVKRYTFAAPVASTATEVGVSICWTPVGTAGANDYITLSQIQLVRNNALTTVAGTNGVALSTNDRRAKAFAYRTLGQETLLQQRYYYQITETATIWPIAPCVAVDVTHTNCLVQFPVPMRTTPTASMTAGFASPTSTTQATLGACSALAAATTVTSTVLNTLNVLVNCTATTIPAAGVGSFLYSNNGAGVIRASAEL